MTSLSETSLLAGSSGVSTGYTIDQSIRFEDGDSPYLYKAYSGAGSKQTFTSSFWMKIGNITSARRGLISFVQDVPLELYSSDNLRVFLFGAERLVTNRKLRDPSAWYHIVLRVDSTQAVSEDRIRLYINGVLETDFSAESYPSQNANGNMWGSNLLQFGRTYGSSYYFDGYLAEIHYADGYSYGPENFGEFKENTDIWIPKEFEGSYGTNGVYLKGEDSSAFGNDSSGNDNDFGNVFGLAANDQRTDSPTNNHCTMNPLRPGSATFANGNLDLSYSASSWTSALGTIGIPYNSGIYYYEAKVISHAIYLSIGWGDVDMGQNQNNNPATPKFYVYSDYSGKYYSSTDDGSIGDGFTNNDVIGLWYDSGSTSNNLKFYRNGTLQSSGTKSFDFSDVAHVAPLTQFYSSNSVEYRFDPAFWTNAPSGITSDNAITTNNVGS